MNAARRRPFPVAHEPGSGRFRNVN